MEQRVADPLNWGNFCGLKIFTSTCEWAVDLHGSAWGHFWSTASCFLVFPLFPIRNSWGAGAGLAAPVNQLPPMPRRPAQRHTEPWHRVVFESSRQLWEVDVTVPTALPKKLRIRWFESASNICRSQDSKAGLSSPNSLASQHLPFLAQRRLQD